MGKKTAVAVCKKAAKKVKFNLPPPSEEEEDVFDKEGCIGFSDEQDDYSDDLEEAVLDLPGSSSEEDDEDLQDEDILEEREEEEKEEGWGKQRKNYYDADKQADLEEEAEEATKLQKKRLSQLSPQDFALYASKFKKAEIILSDSDENDNDGKEGSLEDSKLTEEFKLNVQQLKEVLEPFMARSKDLPRSQGLKFLSVKYQLLGNYCALIIRYLQLKLSSSTQKKEKVNGLVDELIRHRLLLEKMKPMELKLKHQIEKLLNARVDSITMKAGVGSFADDNSEGEEEEEEKINGIYKAPQVTPMPFPGEGRQRKEKEEKEQRFPELHSDFEQVPEEEAFNVAATSTNKNRSLSRKIEEREEYEEDNFVRFTLSRQEKNKLQKASKLNDELDDLEDFMDVLEKKHKKKEQVPVQQRKRVVESDESITDYSSSGEEQQLIKNAKNKKQEKVNGKGSQRITNFRPVEDIERGAERPASKSILANRGLTTTSRPKDIKNPRVKQRRKFERAVKRLPSLHPVAKKGKQSGYGGESSGIRTNISRSTKF